jgi:tRNA (guanine37-N1)-methyltransferase
MKQKQLEKKVEELFQEQGFDTQWQNGTLVAESKEEIKEVKVFSSEEYDIEGVKANLKGQKLVFVDEELAEVQDRIKNDVSIIREERETEEHDLPSYELIGDTAVINELVDMTEEEAVEGIRKYHSHVKTVLLKEESLGGEFRVGNYRKLYGEETETLHREFGCRFKVDPTRVYFSERFSTERNRVVSQIEDDEDVMVMFAGVGPFAVMAAKNRSPRKVVAVEKNPDAMAYLRENIELNNVEEKVRAIEGDVREAIGELEEFDRIVMPLPGSADEFLNSAFEHAKSGAVIHYYRFIQGGDWQPVLE